MAVFPSLTPSGRRRYRMRTTATTRERSITGGDVRFRLAPERFGVPLEFPYEFLTQAQAQLLRDHWNSHGTYRSFPLSPAAWAGHTRTDDISPAWHRWVWAEKPQETHRSGGLVDVVCRLRSVPLIVSA
jgi:hypothetical protein